MAHPAAEQAFAEAVHLFRAGNHAEAFRLTAQAVELDPSYTEASLELARLLNAARQTEEAERVLDEVLGLPSLWRLTDGARVLSL